MGRIFTPPVVEKFHEPRGITGATMEDGTVYRSRHGVMHVDDANHLAAMKRDPRVADNIAQESFAPRRKLDGRWCGACHKSLWSWQNECPKCGAETQEAE